MGWQSPDRGAGGCMVSGSPALALHCFLGVTWPSGAQASHVSGGSHTRGRGGHINLELAIRFSCQGSRVL